MGKEIDSFRALISGYCMIHQFTRIGTLSLMQCGARLSKDLPPYTIACELNELGGLNVLGLRRAGFTAPQRLELRRVYFSLFRSRRKFRDALADARLKFQSEAAQVLLNFCSNSQRGVCVSGRGAKWKAD